MTDQTFEEPDLDELLASATKATEDVYLMLDGKRRDEWNQLVLAAAQAEPTGSGDGRMAAPSKAKQAQKKLDALRQELRSKVLTIRITEMQGTAWAALKAKHKPRKGNLRDENLGYNLEAVTRESLITHGARIRNGEAEPIPVGKWQQILDAAGGGDLQTLELTVLGLNQLVGQQFVGQLVKGSPATSNSAGK
jgi:hypothetical protein